MATYKQTPPYAIQVELTQGCNLQCTFCGINGIQRKPAENYKFMTQKTADRIAREIAKAKWNSRIEFAMHGEPTMNPDMYVILGIFREHLPHHQLMMTSNGGGLLKGGQAHGNIERLFTAGLNILALDDYDVVNIVPKILNKLPDATEQTFMVLPYPDKGTPSPHSRWPKGSRVVLVIQDISSATTGTHSTLNNHCGMGAPLNRSGEGKRCAKPFREMSIRWDGKVALCCNTFSGRYYCGNVNKEHIEEVWNSQGFQIARKHLYHGMRTFHPCEGCDATSYRVGLLPDPKGLHKLPKPTRMDRAWARQHGNERPLTKEVKTPEWEK